MSDARRVVVLAEGLRPGRGIDEVIDAVTELLAREDYGETTIAVLDRGGSKGGLAVGWISTEGERTVRAMGGLRLVLAPVFREVTVVIGETEGLPNRTD